MSDKVIGVLEKVSKRPCL